MSVTLTQDTPRDEHYLLPDHWIGDSSANPFRVMHDYYVDRCLSLLKESGARRVLEAGCGDGWNCGKLVKAGFATTGCDRSKNGIEHCRRLVPGGSFHCGDVRDPEFTAQFREPFDAVLFVEVIEHIPPEDCVEAIRNITSPLKPGGVLVLTTPHVNMPNNNPQHYRHFDEPTLRALLEDGGLSVERVEGYGNEPARIAYWRAIRLVNNGLFMLKPAASLLLAAYRKAIAQPRLATCEGMIALARKPVVAAAHN